MPRPIAVIIVLAQIEKNMSQTRCLAYEVITAARRMFRLPCPQCTFASGWMRLGRKSSEAVGQRPPVRARTRQTEHQRDRWVALQNRWRALQICVSAAAGC
jgi:hypothetical protein